MKPRVRIGCGAGFWGDTAEGPAQLVRDGAIDFLVLDYLAEITMSILARARQKRPELGFATDFVDAVMAPLAREIAEKRIKVVANAGGVNPRGCQAALSRALAKLGVELRIAVVTGDDISAQVESLRASGAQNLEGGPLPASVVSANAYLGAAPIADALRRGADVVITGRCVDSALVLGPLLATFDWPLDDWDRLAQGSLAGHVIECGTQVTGGVFTDWRLVEGGWANMGFPIVECDEDGTFVVTKPAGTGGLVSPATVAEQGRVRVLHDPARYLLADVVCDFSDVHLEQVGDDQVRVTGARGTPATSSYKASLTYQDGYRSGATLLLVGAEAAEKAERVGRAILERTSRLLARAGMADFRETSVEVFGTEHSFGLHARSSAPREVILKVAASHSDERALEVFAREIAPSATSMAQSISGFAGGRPRVQPIVRLASILVPKQLVDAFVELDGQAHPVRGLGVGEDPRAVERGAASNAPVSEEPVSEDSAVVPLRALAHGRSGDKGNTANIGIIARDPAFVGVLRRELTADAVRSFFAHVVRGEVRRYEWPGLSAFNFVLDDALGGGGVASLRHDPQGKGLAQTLLEMPIRVPRAWLREAERVDARSAT